MSRLLKDFCTGRSNSGPAFIVPELDRPASGVTPLDRNNASLLRLGFEDCIVEIDDTQPFYGVVVDGGVVSICQTVRRSGRGIEVGVDTLEGYRRRGYAKAALAAWCWAAGQEGQRGFYSTSWSNRASCGLAKALDLKQFSTEFSVF